MNMKTIREKQKEEKWKRNHRYMASEGDEEEEKEDRQKEFLWERGEIWNKE